MAAVCLDASFVLLWFLKDAKSASAEDLLRSWRGAGADLVGPRMLALEVPSVLRQAVHRGKLTADEGDQALNIFLRMGIRIREPRDIVPRAWRLGKTLNAPRLYDMYYVALAESENCELWSADRRLVNLAGRHLSFVRWVGEPPTSDP